MIKANGVKIDINHFPDGTTLMKFDKFYEPSVIVWHYENENELLALLYITKHLRSHNVQTVSLVMPYIPNARQDRTKNNEDVFTLKYFAEVINSLNFYTVKVLDPHSYVSEGLIDRISIDTPQRFVDRVLDKLGKEREVDLLFYPDEGAMKRYASMFSKPYAFGVKNRDWRTGKILDLRIEGDTNRLKDSRVLIIDDICSRGGTFYYSAKELRKHGAKEVFLYISHCENTILDGDLLNENIIQRVYTTDSIFTKNHKMIEVMHYEGY